jgi:hypothetical protein
MPKDVKDSPELKKFEGLLNQGIPKRLAINMASAKPGDLPTEGLPTIGPKARKK